MQTLPRDIRDKAAVVAELLLERVDEADATEAAIDIARLCDPVEPRAVLAVIDRWTAVLDPAIAVELRALRERVAHIAGPADAGQAPDAAPAEPRRTSAGVPGAFGSILASPSAVRRLARGRAAPGTGASRTSSAGQLAKDLIEDIGALGMLRAPLATQGWGECAGFEGRLLAALDALVALGRTTRLGPGIDLAGAVIAHALEWPVPDPSRTFAASFVLACSERHAPLAVEVALARRTDDRTLAALTAGVALGSNPGIDALLGGRLLDETRPALLVAWLDAARRRRVVPVAALDLLSHPLARVARAAARAASFVDPGESVPRLAAALASERPVSVSAGITLAILGDAEGPAHLRGVVADATRAGSLREDATEALEALALLGDPSDRALFATALEVDPELALLGAFHGDAALLAPMLSAYEASAPDHRGALSAALARIVLPVERSLADPLELTTRARALTGERGRFRAGVRHTPDQTARELADPRTPAGIRPALALEWSLSHRRPPPFDVEDWIARQRASLAAILEPRP